MPETHEFPGLQMMVNKTGGLGVFQSSCFQLEDTLYYYGVKSVQLQTESDKDLVRRLIDRARSDFRFVVVDGGCKPHSFTDVADSIDKAVITVPADLSKAKTVYESVIKNLMLYESHRGLAFKPDIIYVVPQYDGIPSRSKLQGALRSTANNTVYLRYNRELHDYRNTGSLDIWITDLLANPKGLGAKLVHADSRAILQKITDIRLPAMRVKREVQV
jgi:hypothetical protein